MAKGQVSFSKRQREQAKRDRQRLKVEKRAQRRDAPQGSADGADDSLITPDENVDDSERTAPESV